MLNKILNITTNTEWDLIYKYTNFMLYKKIYI